MSMSDYWIDVLYLDISYQILYEYTFLCSFVFEIAQNSIWIGSRRWIIQGIYIFSTFSYGNSLILLQSWWSLTEILTQIHPSKQNTTTSKYATHNDNGIIVVEFCCDGYLGPDYIHSLLWNSAFNLFCYMSKYERKNANLEGICQ